jgi:hypothetical protein
MAADDGLDQRRRTGLTIDIGFDDAIEPGAGMLNCPSSWAFRRRACALTRETVIAKKLQAMVALGRANSRMKDPRSTKTATVDRLCQGT